MFTRAFSLLILLCVVSPVWAQTVTEQIRSTTQVLVNNPEAIELLKKIEAKHQTIQRVQCEFTQKKTSSLFLETIESKGNFWYVKPDQNNPDRLRIEYTKPDILINMIIGDAAYIVNPVIRQVEKYNFKKEDRTTQQLNQMLLGFGQSVTELEKFFHIELAEKDPRADENLLSVIFEPLPHVKNRLFKKCQVNISQKADELYPKSFIIEDTQGDTTLVTIHSVIWNGEISEDKFSLNFPSSWDWIER